MSSEETNYIEYLESCPKFTGNHSHLRELLGSLDDHPGSDPHYTYRHWNLWRKTHLHIIPDLRGIRLKHPSFFRINLEKAGLRNAKIEKGDWSNARFGDVDFRNAVIKDANFTTALMDRAKCQKSRFEECIFIGTKLNKTKFGI